MQRLRTRGQFKAVLEGRPIARTPHFAWHCLRLDGTPSAAAASTLFPPGNSWLGALVPKRWARRAVRRNLIRRQIHALDEHCGMPTGSASVIRMHATFERSTYPSASSEALKRAVRAELRDLLGRGTR
jgi:ribonuclease P protein component